MSATNHTSNYNLPIYEAGNTANWLVDFNGAMSTIDEALNENKLAGDTLKTDMEELQTDFQQVSTKADASEQAATQASQNAANALTIANNATTIAGDAQVDAHAALESVTQISSNVIYSEIVENTSNVPLYGYCHLYMRHTPIGTYYYGEIIVDANNAVTNWPMVPGNNTARYCPQKMSVPSPYLHPFNHEGVYTIGNVGFLNGVYDSNTGLITRSNLNVAWWGVYQDSNNNQYIAIQKSLTANPVTPYWHFATNFFHPNNDTLITPNRLSGLPSFMTLEEFSKYDLNEMVPIEKELMLTV